MNSLAEREGRRLLSKWDTVTSILSVKLVGVDRAFILELVGRVSLPSVESLKILPLGEPPSLFRLEADLTMVAFENVVSDTSEVESERVVAKKSGCSLDLLLRSGDLLRLAERREEGEA